MQTNKLNIILSTSNIFLSAFLLFQVQPIISKYVLPWFGGSPSVWLTAMLFFQCLLVLGYAYSHLISTKLSVSKQIVIHTFIIIIALISLPITPEASLKPNISQNPLWKLLLILLFSVGIPYFILSTTGPLIQKWFSHITPHQSPYKLYALSNIGSLLGLISYPFLFEQLFSSNQQTLIWSVSFFIFAIINIVYAFFYKTHFQKNLNLIQSTVKDHAQILITRYQKFLWLAFPFCSSIILLAVTNQMTQDISVVPFLWILPLIVYLISFIISFSEHEWYKRTAYLFLLIPSSFMFLIVTVWNPIFTITNQLIMYSFPLFVFCMICHGELFKLKPHTNNLTLYYLFISIGGALGSMFVTLLSPILFKTYVELPLGILFVYGLLASTLYTNPKSLLYKGKQKWAWMYISGFIFIISFGFYRFHYLKIYDQTNLRNFYGTLSIRTLYPNDINKAQRALKHGNIVHGTQFVNSEKSKLPITYYAPDSGIGVALNYYKKKQNLKVGTIGLGTGTIAAYGKQNDHYLFYEINPEVDIIAKKYFSYLKSSQAKVETLLGDARTTLENQEKQNFDVLALDAFTGDAIPIHLLTKEAFDIYNKHMNPNGIIAVHVTNRFIDLKPVLKQIQNHYDFEVAKIESKMDLSKFTYPTTWILLTKNKAFMTSNIVTQLNTSFDPKNISLWTDQKNNLFEVAQKF